MAPEIDKVDLNMERLNDLFLPYRHLLSNTQVRILTADFSHDTNYSLKPEESISGMYFPSGYHTVEGSTRDSWKTGISEIYTSVSGETVYEHTINNIPLNNGSNLTTAVSISLEVSERKLFLTTECDLVAISEGIDSPVQVNPEFLNLIKCSYSGDARFNEALEVLVNELSTQYKRTQKVSFSYPLSEPGTIFTVEMYSFNGKIVHRAITHKANEHFRPLTSENDPELADPTITV